MDELLLPHLLPHLVRELDITTTDPEYAQWLFEHKPGNPLMLLGFKWFGEKIEWVGHVATGKYTASVKLIRLVEVKNDDVNNRNNHKAPANKLQAGYRPGAGSQIA